LTIKLVFAGAARVETLTESGSPNQETALGVKKSGKGRRKLGRKKRRMRAKIRHRKK
jgi:hypothetical protein